MPLKPCYFTTTLDHALEYNQSYFSSKAKDTSFGVVQQNPHYSTIPEFVEFLAEKLPDRLALGCVSSYDGDVDCLSFRDIEDITLRLATWIRRCMLDEAEDCGTVALLAPSSLIFALLWLALIRVGCKVLLIAPQNSSLHVGHLLETSNATGVYFAECYSSLIEESADGVDIVKIKIPWTAMADFNKGMADERPDSIKAPSLNSVLSPAYYFHSTGTTGLPKLVPQTHHGAVGALPLLQDIWDKDEKIPATFTTTPLYHGGIPDLFRSWSAGAPLWLFPEYISPLTGENTLQCIEMICSFSEKRNTYLAYLSCVPFVLEILLQEDSALQQLRNLERVGVGGAAMPERLGNKLVSEGVNLVSRFGSSECGFLLSSERNFHSDKDWNILHQTQASDLFQMQEDGLYELVVPLQWPAVSTAEHAARPFRTKDLFKARDNGWEYVGRADAQLTLATGKKINAEGIEGTLRESDSIEDAIIVGEGKLQPGLLVFASEEASNEAVERQKEKIENVVRKVNAANPAHARIKKDMMKIVAAKEQPHLKRNHKGALVKSYIKNAFQDDIDSLHAPAVHILNTSSSDEDIEKFVMNIVTGQLSISESEVSDQKTLLEYGLDSGGYMQIRNQLQGLLASINITSNLSLSTIYQFNTIKDIIAWMKRTLRTGTADQALEAAKVQEQAYAEAHDMIDRLLSSRSNGSTQSRCLEIEAKSSMPLCRKEVILTGATGFLGSHILSKLQMDTSVAKIHLLVRRRRRRRRSGAQVEDQQKQAESQIDHALRQRGLPEKDDEKRIVIYAVDFDKPKLNLTDEQHQSLFHNTSCIIHVAWNVNFNLPLQAFESQIQALMHLYDQLKASGCTTERRSLVFCSSKGAATALDKDSKPKNGYLQSKWVAEQVLERSNGLNVTIARIGQLCGDTKHGIWNRQEAWPLMIDAGFHIIPQLCNTNSQASLEAILPDLARAKQPAIDWLPVDVAADRILQLSLKQSLAREVRTEAVTNTSSRFSWAKFQQLVKQDAQRYTGYKVGFISASEWLNLLVKAEPNQAQALVPLWRENWLFTEKLTAPALDDGRDRVEQQEPDLLTEKSLWQNVAWVLGLNEKRSAP